MLYLFSFEVVFFDLTPFITLNKGRTYAPLFQSGADAKKCKQGRTYTTSLKVVVMRSLRAKK